MGGETRDTVFGGKDGHAAIMHENFPTDGDVEEGKVWMEVQVRDAVQQSRSPIATAASEMAKDVVSVNMSTPTQSSLCSVFCCILFN